MLFEQWHAIFFGGTGIDGALVNDDVALLERLADGDGGFEHRREVRLVGCVDRGRNGDDVEVGLAELFDVRGVEDVGSFEFNVGDFASGVVSGFEGVDAGTVDVEADGLTALAESDGDGEPDVAESYNGDDSVVGHRL